MIKIEEATAAFHIAQLQMGGGRGNEFGCIVDKTESHVSACVRVQVHAPGYNKHTHMSFVYLRTACSKGLGMMQRVHGAAFAHVP